MVERKTEHVERENLEKMSKERNRHANSSCQTRGADEERLAPMATSWMVKRGVGHVEARSTSPAAVLDLKREGR